MTTNQKHGPIHTFNTGRLYTQHGQRIAWALLPSGNVFMVDADRHIDYVLAVPPNPTDDDVLRAYDACAQGADLAEWSATRGLYDHFAAFAMADLIYKLDSANPDYYRVVPRSKAGRAYFRDHIEECEPCAHVYQPTAHAQSIKPATDAGLRVVVDCGIDAP